MTDPQKLSQLGWAILGLVKPDNAGLPSEKEVAAANTVERELRKVMRDELVLCRVLHDATDDV